MANKYMVLLTAVIFYTISITSAQRGFYAGSRPRGYKDKYVPRNEEEIANRFGGETVNTIDGTVPVNAHGDILLVNRLAALPTDKQPFWFLNYKILEQLRQQSASAQTVQSVPISSRSPFAGTSGLDNTQNIRPVPNVAQGATVNVGTRFGLNSVPNVPVRSYQGPLIGPFPLIKGVPLN